VIESRVSPVCPEHVVRRLDPERLEVKEIHCLGLSCEQRDKSVPRSATFREP
jgi:hypothetical protein